MQRSASCATLWSVYSQEIPPYETKGVMRASFSSREADNHTAFIRIKTNASDSTEFIILPVEVEVTTGQWKTGGVQSLFSSQSPVLAE